MYCTIEEGPFYLSLWAFDSKRRVVSLSLSLSSEIEMGGPWWLGGERGLGLFDRLLWIKGGMKGKGEGERKGG